MYITIDIRGAARTSRHRSGEEVSDPDVEFEGGDEGPAPVLVVRLDQKRVDRDGYLDHARGSLESWAEPQQDMRIIGSTGGAFSGQSGDESEEDTSHAHARAHPDRAVPTQGELLRLATSRPRRFLKRLHAESKHRGKITVRFERALAAGRAVFEITVCRGKVTAAARFEVANALGGAMGARAQRLKGLARFEVEGEATLRPNGDLERLTGDWKTRGLELDPREEELIERLARTVARVVDKGCISSSAKRRLGRILQDTLREHPIWAVALLDRLLANVSALPLHPSLRQLREEHRRDRGGFTLEDILSESCEPATAELLLNIPAAPPSLKWSDDQTSRIVACDSETSAQAQLELTRLACVIPVLLDILD